MEIFQGCIQCLKILSASSCVFPSLIPFSVPLKTLPVGPPPPRACPSTLCPSGMLSIPGKQGSGMSLNAQVRVDDGEVASLPPSHSLCRHGEPRHGFLRSFWKGCLFHKPQKTQFLEREPGGTAVLSREIFITQQLSLKIQKMVLAVCVHETAGNRRGLPSWMESIASPAHLLRDPTSLEVLLPPPHPGECRLTLQRQGNVLNIIPIHQAL